MPAPWGEQKFARLAGAGLRAAAVGSAGQSHDDRSAGLHARRNDVFSASAVLFVLMIGVAWLAKPWRPQAAGGCQQGT